MSEQQDHFLIAWWAENLDKLDREIGWLAVLCLLRILDPHVMACVLQKDASVCGTHNPVAFAKLHDLLTRELIRFESADPLNAFGEPCRVERKSMRARVTARRAARHSLRTVDPHQIPTECRRFTYYFMRVVG